MYWSSRSVFKERSYFVCLFQGADKSISSAYFGVNNYFAFFHALFAKGKSRANWDTGLLPLLPFMPILFICVHACRQCSLLVFLYHANPRVMSSVLWDGDEEDVCPPYDLLLSHGLGSEGYHVGVVNFKKLKKIIKRIIESVINFYICNSFLRHLFCLFRMQQKNRKP